jgi:class 3 adenylate cyclase
MIDFNQVREGLREIDIAVHNLWTLGKNMIVGWITADDGIEVCFAPVYRVLSEATTNPRLLDGGRHMDGPTFTAACKTLQGRPLHLSLPFKIRTETQPGDVEAEAVDAVIRRYSIVRTANRAVMLFDIVGFSAASPIEQLAQFTSLESSISTAGEKLCELGLDVELARSTAGDGYIYVWNRSSGLEADLRTYAALLLTLVDNALSRNDVGATSRLVPRLRVGFTVGSHYSYHQVEGTKPRSFEYATGQVTITLARIVAKALPSQVLIGNFQRPVDGAAKELDSVLFLARAERLLGRLAGTELGGFPLKEVRSIVSGGRLGKRAQSVLKYSIADKHGNHYEAFNLIVRVEREGAPRLEFGLRPEKLPGFEAAPAVYDIPVTPAEQAPVA